MQISVLFSYFTHSVRITKIKSLFCKTELFFTPLLFSKEQKMAYHAIYLLLKLGYTPKKAAIVSGGIFCSEREENYRLFQNRADRFSLYFLQWKHHLSIIIWVKSVEASWRKYSKKLNFFRQRPFFVHCKTHFNSCVFTIQIGMVDLIMGESCS